MAGITWGTAAAVLAAPFVFVLPGWALLALLFPSWLPRLKPVGPSGQAARGADQAPCAASFFILAAGLTLAAGPVGLLLCYLAGIKIGTELVLAVLAVSAAIVLWRQLSAGSRRAAAVSPGARSDRAPERPNGGVLPLVALLLVAGLALGVRLWVVRGLNVGFWGDSFQHTLITRLMLDNGGLFQSWLPYAPLKTFTYHYGFHGHVALFQWATGWLTGNDTQRAVVLVGQLINTLAVLALYPLTVRLSGGSRWAGIVAVLVAGLLAPMPMYYVNWGRYTQLAGQAILPAALWFTLDALDAPCWSWRRLAPAILALAGLALTHYRVAALGVAFLAPYLLYRWWRGHREGRPWLQSTSRLAVVGLGSLALALPWLLHLGAGFFPVIAQGFVQRQAPQAYVVEYNAIGPLQTFISYPLLVLAGLGALWSMWRRQPAALVVPWVGLAWLMTNPHVLGLPGTGLMTNFAIAIALYLPVSILAGAGVGHALAAVSREAPPGRAPARWARPAGYAAVIALFAVGVYGARDRASVIDPAFQLVTLADLEAMAWIRAHTAPNARFLVNSFFAYGDTVAAGADAGWWIPLLTGRANTQPPLNYGTEAGFESGYLLQVNDFVRRVQGLALDDPAAVEFLRSNGVTHVYIGDRGGRAGAPDEPLLNPSVLQASPLYRVAYHQAGVWIFEIAPGQE